MSENEIWKDVVGYEGLYKVSNKGSIYSVERTSTIGRKIGGRMLKPTHDKDGYLIVSLSKNGTKKLKKIHRLVTETFIPNPNNLPQVNHHDEDKANNDVKNLEWCTSKQNNNHGTRTERIAQKTSRKVRAVNVKTGDVVIFSSTREAGRKDYGQGNVSSACRGVYYGGHLYRGHTWSYV